MNHPIPNEKITEVVAALTRGEVLLAIKIYRDAANCDLAEAKQAVETLQSALKMANLLGNQPGNLSSHTTTTTTGTTTEVTSFSMSVNGVRLPDDIAAHVKGALQRGDKIEAIKAIRCATNVGLREAKDAIELISSAAINRHFDFQHQQEQATAQPTTFRSGERTRGMSVWVWFFVLVMIGCVIWWFASR